MTLSWMLLGLFMVYGVATLTCMRALCKAAVSTRD